MRLLIIYLSTAVVMLPLDFAFLGTIGRKMFEREVPDMLAANPRAAPAIIFYLVYLVGIVALINSPAPADWRHNVIYGGLLGLVAYATFELTNMAVLKHWTWSVVLTDMIWGVIVTATAASAGGLLASWIIRRIS